MNTLLFTLQNWLLTARYYLTCERYSHCEGCGESLSDPYERSNGICQSCGAW